MDILLVAATEAETAPLRRLWQWESLREGLFRSERQGHALTLLHTGIGMVGTAYALGRHLAQHRPALAVNVGIAGSFDPGLQLGTVVEVVEDSFSELGAEDGNDWLDLQAMGFAQFEREGQKFFNTFHNPRPSALSLAKVTGITVNTVHGRESSIEQVRRRWGKTIETMEGAAFFHVMLREGLPFLAFRSISNHVLLRDKSQWRLKLAVENLATFLEVSLATGFRD